jgi:sugar/nucleoside kinase (ribokinase family)
LEHVTFSTGGGATNAAVTFARQALHAIYLGKTGNDPAARAILDELHSEGVDTTLVKQSDDYHTGYSTVLLSPEGDRTILAYRGASSNFLVEDFDMANMNGDWLYISSLAGNMEVFEKLVNTAKSKGIKIAINPGKGELAQSDWLKALIHKVDVLTLNKEELQSLVEGDDDMALVRNASDMASTVVMTDGPRGVIATDRSKFVKAGMYEDVPVIDRTGAGDAFGSGLVARLAKGADLTEAIKFASANSTSVVSQIGAKAGILDESAQLHDMPMEITDF